MSALVTLSFLLGALLGLRFKVLVLVPLTASLGIAAIVVGLVTHVGAVTIFWGYALCAILLQAGYLVGSVARSWVVVGRLPRGLPRAMPATPRLRARHRERAL